MDSAAIMLLPDATYRAARPKTKDHHLTVAFYGAASNITTNGQSRLRGTVDTIARTFGPIKARANGLGMFKNPDDGIAIVDLIDGIGSVDVRMLVTKLDGFDGVKIDTRHGFTPHITREFLAPEDDFYAELNPDQIDNIEFQFVAVGLWFGDQRYEVSL